MLKSLPHYPLDKVEINPLVWTEPFCVAVFGLNEITGLTDSHVALLRTEFLIIFLRFRSSGGGGNLNVSQIFFLILFLRFGGGGGGRCGGDLNNSQNAAIRPIFLFFREIVEVENQFRTFLKDFENNMESSLF